tara:strand:- start:463 stop:1176 length:714 start_codon:yes stop_codon:yes gene_type:complete
MAIPVKIKDEDDDGHIDDVYKNEFGITTKSENAKADENDKLIEAKMREIEKAMKSQKPTLDAAPKDAKSLIELQNRDGVIELWYNVGKMLRDFIDSLDVSVQNAKWIFRALYDHRGELGVNLDLSRDLRNNPGESHFAYCYRLGGFEWELAKSMIWTHWSEFFDGPLFKRDPRIIDWIKTKQDKPKGQDWLRPLTKKIRNKLKKKRTDIAFSNEELIELLDKIFDETYSEKVKPEKI